MQQALTARRLALVLLAGLLAACGGAAPSDPARLRGCDDGGSGGVVIDGVCL